ncbi:MAG: hypothetical protein H0U21_06140 [Acidimicrobiia bacterium]|nr:hypothetical protein [Acidimicrobiia bacterium]
MRRDVERLNALTLEGLVPFQFTYDMVVGDPAGALRTVRQALAPSTSANLQAS